MAHTQIKPHENRLATVDEDTPEVRYTEKGASPPLNAPHLCNGLATPETPLSEILDTTLPPQSAVPLATNDQSDLSDMARKMNCDKSLSTVPFVSYRFLSASGLGNLDSDAAGYLELQSCLDVPCRPILSEFARQYFRHVHPLLPLIDEGDFWDIFYRPSHVSDPRGGFSLLVLQAMLFVSSSVSLELRNSNAQTWRTNLLINLVCLR